MVIRKSQEFSITLPAIFRRLYPAAHESMQRLSHAGAVVAVTYIYSAFSPRKHGLLRQYWYNITLAMLVAR